VQSPQSSGKLPSQIIGTKTVGEASSFEASTSRKLMLKEAERVTADVDRFLKEMGAGYPSVERTDANLLHSLN